MFNKGEPVIFEGKRYLFSGQQHGYATIIDTFDDDKTHTVDLEKLKTPTLGDLGDVEPMFTRNQPVYHKEWQIRYLFDSYLGTKKAYIRDFLKGPYSDKWITNLEELVAVPLELTPHPRELSTIATRPSGTAQVPIFPASIDAEITEIENERLRPPLNYNNTRRLLGKSHY